MIDPTPMIMGGISVTGMVAIIITVLYFNFQKRKLQNTEVLSALDKGIEIPVAPKKHYNRQAQGILWTAVGIALLLAFYISTGAWSESIWAILPIAIGLSLLLIARMERNGE
jgi:hypothetical protein